MTSNIKYENGKIYKIVCRKTGLVYVGSTTKPLLCQRLAMHRNAYKNYLNGKFHNVTVFKLLENNDYYIELLENANCNSKDELLRRERHYIETLNCVNRCIPLQTNQEYYQVHKEEIKIKGLEYREKNKDAINEKARKYHHDNKEKRKEYRENNKEHYKELKKQYYEKTKDKVKERVTQLYVCSVCGCELQIKSKGRHEKTNRNHLQLLESQTQK